MIKTIKLRAEPSITILLSNLNISSTLIDGKNEKEINSGSELIQNSTLHSFVIPHKRIFPVSKDKCYKFLGLLLLITHA